MKRKGTRITVLIGASLLAAAALALAAQDKYTVKVPNGLAFSEFRGYESWQYVASSQTADRLKIIGGNSKMITAYKDGYPTNGKSFPEGSVLTKSNGPKSPAPNFRLKPRCREISRR